MDAKLEECSGQPINWAEWSYIHMKVNSLVQ